MALGSPSIKTRGEFEAEAERGNLPGQSAARADADYPPLESIRRQLGAMHKWTQGGRTPTQESAGEIAIGVIAMRELEDDDHLGNLCHKLNYFFQEWPLGRGQ